MENQYYCTVEIEKKEKRYNAEVVQQINRQKKNMAKFWAELLTLGLKSGLYHQCLALTPFHSSFITIFRH